MQVAYGSDALDVSIATIESAADGSFDGAKIHLGKTDIPIDRDTDLATLVAGVADFHTYAAKTLTWAAPTYDEAGRIVLQGSCAAFIPTDAVVPNTIFYWWVTDTAGTALLMKGRFLDTGGIPMEDVTNSIIPYVRYWPQSGGFSEVIY